jgi:hypothetical protein
MKTISMFLMLIVAGWSLTACDESYDDWAQPKVYEQEPAVTIEGFEATPTAAASGSIILADLADEGVQLFTLKQGTLPEGVTLSNIRLSAWPADKTEAVAANVAASEDGKVTKAELEKLVYTFYGKKSTERTFTAKLFANAMKESQAQLITLGDFTLKITPEEVENPYYYIYGNATSSKKEEAYKTVMTPDPNSDVVFTYTTKYVSSGDVKVWNSKYWQEGYASNDFSKLYGSGEKTAYKGESGKLEQGKNSSIFSPTKEYYTFTIDLEALTYKWVKLEDQNPASYNNISLIGIGNDWNTDVDMAPADKAKHNWFVQVTIAADTQLKFRADHAWNTDWGYGDADGDWTVNEDLWAKTLEKGKKNIAVPAGKYNVYFCDITGAAHFVPTE